jgi:predicted kinase
MSQSQHFEPFPRPSAPGPAGPPGPTPATLILVVGLPGAGKTTRARELAATLPALRLTPDHWMIPLFGDSMAGGKRLALEGRLIAVALQALRLGTSVVLDFGLWGRDERWALRWLAQPAGAACQVLYLPVARDVQLARVARRQATAPHQTFPMSEADLDQWREEFQVPDAAELHGGEIPRPPRPWPPVRRPAERSWPTARPERTPASAPARRPGSGSRSPTSPAR